MTIAATTRKAGPFSGNDVATEFPFGFRVFSKSDIEVILTGAEGGEATLTLDSHYSVALNADQDANPGGTVTYPISGDPLATGEKLTGIGSLPESQETDITNGGGFFPQVIEDRFDYLTILIQQLRERSNRSLALAPSDTFVDLPAAATRANKYLHFDANGTPEMAELIAGGTSLSAGVIGGYLYPRTAAELAAGVTPSAYQYPPGDIRRYGAVGDGITNDSVAIQAAINSNDTVDLCGLNCKIASGVTFDSRLKIKNGTITGASNIHLLTPAAASIALLSLEDVTLVAAGTGVAVRLVRTGGCVIDRVTVKSCIMSGGLGHIHMVPMVGGDETRAKYVAVENSEFSGCTGDGVWLGGYGAATDVAITRGNKFFTTATETGSALVFYGCESATSSDDVFDTCGPQASGSNQYHSVYGKANRRLTVSGLTVVRQGGGAGFHVYDATPSNESVELTEFDIRDCGSYAGVRVDNAVSVIIGAGYVSGCKSNAVRVSNATDVYCSDIQSVNNNVGNYAPTTVDNAAFAFETIARARLNNCHNLNTSATGNKTAIWAKTFSASLSVSGCGHTVTSGGYYHIESDAVPSVRYARNEMDGCSTMINATWVDAVVAGNYSVNNSASALITGAADPFHAWAIRDNYVQGAPYRHESDGVNYSKWDTAAPVSGTWARGDMVRNSTPSAAAAPGWLCVTAGSPGTWKAMANLAA